MLNAERGRSVGAANWVGRIWPGRSQYSMYGVASVLINIEEIVNNSRGIRREERRREEKNKMDRMKGKEEGIYRRPANDYIMLLLYGDPPQKASGRLSVLHAGFPSTSDMLGHDCKISIMAIY